MKKSFDFSSEIKFYFRQTKIYYIFFGVSFFVGVIIGLILAFTSSFHLQLLHSGDKIIFTLLNGTANYSGLFWKSVFQFILPVLILFLLNLNYYVGFFSYLFVGYQSALFVLTCSAIVETYGFSGVLAVLFFLIPANLILFCAVFFAGTTFRERSRLSLDEKLFQAGFDSLFFIKFTITVVVIFLLSFLVSFVFPIFLKNMTFIVF